MQGTTPHRSLKEKQRQEREELILRAAEEVLLEKGYHDTSMDEIAARVGIAKGTLYLHFARKEELVFALIEREFQALLRMFDEAMSIEGTAQTKLAFILRAIYQGMVGKRTQVFSILYNSPDSRVLMNERHGVLMELFTSRIGVLLDEGKREGLFDTSLPTEVMLSTFLGMLSLRAYKKLVLEEYMSSEDVARYVERIYFRGIAADTQAKEE